ncbi:MAG: hypothetical protein N3F03_05265 [Ignavibacteria bacterium]|nr:hypothetical protein [Ignavibacteria bacterium]
MNNYNGILSLLIFCIELVLIINVLIFSKSKFKSNIITILSFLAAYQFFEFLVCGLNLKYNFVIYLGLVSITFLPPLGLSFALKLNKYKKSKLNSFIYTPAIFFSIYFLLSINRLRNIECSFLYASYSYPLEFLYGVFYYLPIVISIFIFVREYVNAKDVTIKKQNLILLIGYLLFLLPMILTLILNPRTIEYIESILCKFAFGLALILFYFALKFRK